MVSLNISTLKIFLHRNTLGFKYNLFKGRRHGVPDNIRDRRKVEYYKKTSLQAMQ